MADIADLKREIKKQVKSLLLSTPKGLTSRELLNDFRQFEGRPLPYRELGFASAEEFFRDISDAVQITWQNGELVLRPIADETTRHIERLVSRQVSKKGGRGRGRGPPPSYRSYRSYRHRRSPPLPTVNNFLRARIKELLLSYPSGLLGSSFGSAFAKRYGQHLNFIQLGFKSLGDLLRTLKDDIVEYEELKGGGFKLHLVGSRSPKPSHQPPGAKTYSQPVQYRPPPGASPPLDGSPPPGDGFFLPSVDECRLERSSVPTKSPRKRRNSSLSVGDDDDSEINTRIKENVKKVLKKRPAGMWCARLPVEYKAEFGEELPFKDLGFVSVVKFVSAIPDIVAIERPDPKRDWFLYDAETKKSSQEKNEEKEEAAKSPASLPCQDTETLPVRSSAPSLDQKFKETVRQVLEDCPAGVVLSALPEMYQELVGEKMPVQELGFASLESLLITLQKDVLHMEYRGEGRVLLFAVPATEPHPYGNLLMKKIQDEKEKKEKVTCKSSIPSDVVGPGVGYVPPPIPKTQDYMEIYVSNVVNPGKFWIQIKGNKSTMALEELMDRLEEVYYGREGDNYTMPDSLVVIGQVCAATFPEDENWHRVVITGISSIDFIEAYFVDYGNTCCVARSGLRMLKSRFLKLPAQAIQARLANIRPKDKEEGWTRAARDRLLRMCCDRALIALPTKTENDVISVCLCDTSSSEDIHINDVLVAEGHAEFFPDDSDLPEAQKIMAQLQPQARDIPALLSVAPTVDLKTLLTTPNVVPQFSPVQPSKTLSPRHGQVGSPECAADSRSTKSGGRESHHSGAASSAASDFNSDYTPEPRYVKFVELTEHHTAHIILYNKCGYIISAEISSYLWDKDLLRSVLRQKRLSIAKVVLGKEEHEELFEQMKEYQVPGILDGSDVRSHVTLYDLKTAVEILENLGCQDEALIQALKEEVRVFNADDPYWKGEDEGDDSGSTSDFLEFEMDLDDLQLALQALQFRRQRILNNMLTDTNGSAVEVVRNVENDMSRIRNRIKEMKEAEEAKQAKSSVKFTPEEEYIHQLVDQQIKASQTQSPKTNRVTPLIKGAAPSVSNPASGDAQMNAVPQLNPAMLQQQLWTPQQQQLQQQQQLMLQYQMLLAQSPQLLQSSLLNPLMFPGQMPMPFLQMPGLNPGQGINPGLNPAMGLGRGQVMNNNNLSHLMEGLNLGQIRPNVGQGRGKVRNPPNM